MLHPEILVDDRVAELERGCRAVMPDSAFLHDVDALARFQRQRHVLLHQQNRHALPVQHVDDLSDLPNHARHQPFGGLVQQDDLGLEHHRAGDGEHLLLASRERAAGLVAPLGQHREISEGLVEQLLLSRFGHAVAIETGAQILHHRQQTKNPPILANLCAGKFVTGLPANSTLPRVGWTSPMMVLSVVLLPTPLRPSRPTTSPRSTWSETPCKMWLLP